MYFKTEKQNYYELFEVNKHNAFWSMENYKVNNSQEGAYWCKRLNDSILFTAE